MSYTVMFVMYRKEGLSHEQFAEHLVNNHAPIVRAMPQLRDYTIFPVSGSAEVDEPAPDGFSILTFDSEADFQAMLAAPAMETSHADADTFVGRSGMYVLEQHPIA